MRITITETEFRDSWEGDGMRPGDNIRSHSWTGQFVTITLDGDENVFLATAVKEYDRCQPISITPEQVEQAIISRAAHLAWCAAWSTYYHQDQGGWYVGTDYAPADRPEVYDDGGNFIGFLPKSVNPGDFATLAPLVSEMFRCCE